ncbi:hypothetical protein [Tautonia marina]|uniref:hypothetical protein n=1 Tax=Tautonia marina TaxID=2653855 RepID=UPI0012613026|nr:hypothetical protein [Tautonia marina]
MKSLRGHHAAARPHPDEAPVTPRRTFVPRQHARVFAATLALIVGLAAIHLSPTLFTGYLSDDGITSLVPGMLTYTGESLTTRVVNSMRNVMLSGRFYPLHWIPFNGIFAAIPDVFFYKCYILLMILGNIALFATFVRSLTGDRGLACLACLGTICAMQVRPFHDPILSFFGLLQIVVALLLISLIALDAALTGRGRGWLILGVVAYFVAMLTYEVTYPLFVLHLLLIVYRRPGWRARLQDAMPFFQVVGLCVFLSILLRWLHPNAKPEPGGNLPGYVHDMNLDAAEILTTLGRQAVSALPLSSFIEDSAGLFGDVQGPAAFVRWVGQTEVMGLGVLAMLACSLSLRQLHDGKEAPSRRAYGFFLLFGLVLAVLPGLTTSVCMRYQELVTPGTGYVPVYIQYFGVGLVLASGIGYAVTRWSASGSRARRVARVVTATSLAGLIGVSYRANADTCVALVSPPGSRHFNETAFRMEGGWHHARVNLETALRAGVLDEVPEYSQLVLTNEYAPWHSTVFSLFFYAMNAEKILAVMPPSFLSGASMTTETHRAMLGQHPMNAESRYRITDASFGPRTGFVLVWPEEEDGAEGRGTGARLFVRFPEADREGAEKHFRLVGSFKDPERAGTFSQRLHEFPLLETGTGWSMYRFGNELSHIRPETLTLTFDR